MKKIYISLIAVLIAALSFAQSGKLKIDGNFEDGSRTIGGKLTVANPLTDSGAVLTSDYAIGTKALRFTIASNDSTPSFFPRSEYIIAKNGADSAIADDYFGFNVTFLNWTVDPRQGLITQSFTAAYPVFSVWFTTVSGKPWLQIVRQYDSTAIGDGSTSDPNFVQEKWNLKEIISGETIRLDFIRRWRADYTGLIEVYLNKTLVKTFTGVNTIKPYNPSVPKQPVDRIGIYWFGAKPAPATPNVLVRRAIFDNVSVGRASDMTKEQYLNYYSTATVVPTTQIKVPFKIKTN